MRCLIHNFLVCAGGDTGDKPAFRPDPSSLPDPGTSHTRANFVEAGFIGVLLLIIFFHEDLFAHRQEDERSKSQVMLNVQHGSLCRLRPDMMRTHILICTHK